MTGNRRTAFIVSGIVALMALVAPAWAFWTASASPAPQAVPTNSLSAPSAGNLSGVTASSIVINITGAPATGAAPSGYRVDRTVGGTTTQNVCGGITGITGSCTDSGLNGGTLYSYAIFSKLGSNWISATSFPLSTTTPSGDVTAPITTATPSPTPNAAGWNKASVTVTLSATDNNGGTGVKSITFSASGAQTIAQNTVLTSTGTNVPAITTQGTTTVSYFATDVAGNVENTKTVTVRLDTAGPTNSIALTNQSSASSFLTGDTVFYKGNTTGSFALRNSVGDALSGPKSSATAALGGTATGWSHTPSTVTTPTFGSSYDSGAFSWAANTSSSPTEIVTSADIADNTTSRTALTFVNDVSAPTGGSLVVNGGSSTSSTSAFAITSRTNFSGDLGSGLASSVLTVQSESYDGTTCGAPGSGGPFMSPTTVSGTTQPSGVQRGYCYVYTLTGTDNVGNTATVSSTVTVTTSYTFSVSNPGGRTAGAAFGGIVLQLQANGADTSAYYGSAYTGVKAVSFTGPASSPSGAAPTFPANVAFTNGTATLPPSSITLVKAETVALTATDRSFSPDVVGISSPFTVAAGAANRLAWNGVAMSSGTTSGCFFTCTYNGVGNNSTFTARIALTDSSGNQVAATSSVSITVAKDSGTFSGTNVLTIPAGASISTGTLSYGPPNGNNTASLSMSSAPSWPGATATFTN